MTHNKKIKKVPKWSQKMQRTAKKGQKLQKSVIMAGFHNIGATNHTRRESGCLPYVVSFYNGNLIWTLWHAPGYESWGKQTRPSFQRSAS